MYKTVDELTADQLAELKEAIECEYIGKDMEVPPEMLGEDGEITDSAVKGYFAATMFTDDDFCCSAA